MYRESVFVRAGLAPVRGLNKAFGNLSGMGFKSIVCPLLAFGSFCVMTEAAYKVLPESEWSIPREERAFFPKAGIDDGAEFTRLVPLKRPVTMIAQWLAPDWLDPYVPSSINRTVWADPLFYFAVIVCAAVQYQESKLFQRKEYARVRAEAEAANRTSKINLNPKALDYARAKVAKHNSYGMGAQTLSGASIFLLYAFELIGGFASMWGAGSKLASLLWSLYGAFGFEIFHTRDAQAPINVSASEVK